MQKNVLKDNYVAHAKYTTIYMYRYNVFNYTVNFRHNDGENLCLTGES